MADFVFGKGISEALIFLKEIDAINKGCEGVRKVASKFKKAINKNLAHNPLVVTHEGVTLRMPSSALPPAGLVKEVITDSHKLLESVVSGRLSEVGREIEALKNIKSPKGFKEFKNKHIKLDFEHVLGMEPQWSKRGKLDLGGFHHDLGYTVEKTGVFEFKDRIITKHGVSKSKMIYNGYPVKDVTLFPADWSRRKVVNKIYEAYNDFVATKGIAVEKGGKYMIEGFTQEGIKVRMFITKNGVIKSAYPI